MVAVETVAPQDAAASEAQVATEATRAQAATEAMAVLAGLARLRHPPPILAAPAAREVTAVPVARARAMAARVAAVASVAPAFKGPMELQVHSVAVPEATARPVARADAAVHRVPVELRQQERQDSLATSGHLA